MEINEQTNIQPEQYNQFLPKQKFNIPKSTIQKVKSTITSLNSGLVSSDNFSTSASTPFTFVINPNNQTVIDLSQCYFNVAGTLNVPSDYFILPTNDIMFGNLFLSSLFQQATLSIGGTVVALNANPGIDANIQAALKFDAYDLTTKNLSDRQFMINHMDPMFKPEKNINITFAAGDFTFTSSSDNGQAVGVSTKVMPQYKNLTLVYNNPAGPDNISVNITHVKNFTIIFDDTGSATIIVNSATVNPLATPENSTFTNQFNFTIFGQQDNMTSITSSAMPVARIYGQHLNINESQKSIPFRCKFYLSDLFNYTVDSLDYIFNREISITLQRSSINSIIANVIGANSNYNATVNVSGITKFELICFSYLLTDTAKQQLMGYYSKPVETLFGVQTTNLTPLYNNTSGTEQNITLPLTVNFDTKCILLAFPKCSNALQPLSTGSNMEIVNQSELPGANNVNKIIQASWFGSNSNSYNFAGLKYIRISNTSNSNIYTYDFNGTAEQVYGPKPLLHGFDTKNADPGAQNGNIISSILDYREAYSQYKQIRLLFGKDPDNGISYYDYLKDYCVIPIDLTGSNIPPNTRIFVTFQFADWVSPYNPLFFGNIEGNGQKQLTTNLLAVFLGSDVLQYNPDGTCLVKHILTTGTNEKTVNIK